MSTSPSPPTPNPPDAWSELVRDPDFPDLHAPTIDARTRALTPSTSIQPDRHWKAHANGELPPDCPLNGGRYTIDRVLGRGGFGITYAATDVRLHRPVAIKELFPLAAQRQSGSLTVTTPDPTGGSFEAAKVRFLREATVLARFTDPRIVQVYEVFEEHNTAYLVMELLNGRTLADLLDERGGRFTEAEALDVAARCARALMEIHGADVLHRDLNPSNVMVSATGRVVLIDFGLAQTFEPEQTSAMTRMVTPGYAPPEQYLGQARFGPATDVYGLAATLYRLLAGQAPVSALDRQGGARLPSLRELNPAISSLVNSAVLDGLELNANHRPQTMEAFLARLGLGASEPPLRSLLAGAAGGPGAANGAPPHAPPPPAPAPPPRPAPPGAPGGRGALGVDPRRFDGERHPLPLPPPPPGQWKVTAPAFATIAALGAAGPVLGVVVLATVLLPGVATVGDGITFVRLRRQGARLKWLHRVALPGFSVMRFVRNLAAVLRAGVPALVVGAGAVAITLLLGALGAGVHAQELILRPAGAVAAVLLALPVVRERWRFRVDVVSDAVYERAVDARGRLTHFGLGLWLVATIVVCLGVGLRPDLWPLSP